MAKEEKNKNMVDLTGHWFVYFGASGAVVEDADG